MTTHNTDDRYDELALVEPIDSAAVLANARALLPLVERESAAAEQAGHLTPILNDAFRRAGLFEMAFPARHGGPELTLEAQTRVVACIAAKDAGIAWNVAVLAATGFYAARLGNDAYAELYPTRDLPTCGSFWPRGRADKADGGYLVEGTWDWGSGIYSADRIVGGCAVFEDGTPVIGPNGRQLVMGMWLPTEAIQLADNWHALGLRASGSTSYAVPPGTFVPDNHCFDRYAAPDLSSDPLNRHVELVFFSLVGVTLGMAEHVFDACVAALLERMGGSSSQSLDSSIRRGLGEVAATVDAMRSHVYAVARATDEAIFDDKRALTPTELARHRSTLAMAATLMRRVLEVATDLVGSRFVFAGHPVEKIIRDANTAFAHISSKRSQWIDTGGAILDSLRMHNVSPFDGPPRGGTPTPDRMF